ncbi:PaaI family thioesterase [Conexibacter sp. SYSU D00693]|uniref:PaaI family thioesterase n=1 Tax=Conexibacter sp. SYSU D00693 TaxID=2812560 RepID=UPI00196B57F1|nr:PaaI family thioesterase [Conexibacter sp. SYSU D00693]
MAEQLAHDPEATDRSLTITWEDPMGIAAAAAGRSGLEFLQAMVSGEVPKPPISELLGATAVEVEEGRVVFRIVPHESHYNPIGAVHGGIHATVLDAAMGCAVHSTLPAGTGYTTLEIKVNYVRAFRVDTGPAIATGTVIHRGGRIATAEGRLERESDGQLIAHATTTCIVFAP